jgi:heme/copper-type cytochrome/quinol oxidase subunit 2
MRTGNKKLDLFFLVVIILIVGGLPFGISYYDDYVSSAKIPPDARVPAYQAVSFWNQQGQPIEKPVIEVSKGDLVVFKLTSSDVVHGFSLKDFAVLLTDGIQPGKATYVSFKADKAGVFTFSCNAICGDSHQNMQGTLVVRA